MLPPLTVFVGLEDDEVSPHQGKTRSQLLGSVNQSLLYPFLSRIISKHGAALPDQRVPAEDVCVHASVVVASLRSIIVPN